MSSSELALESCSSAAAKAPRLSTMVSESPPQSKDNHRVLRFIFVLK